MPRGSTIQQTKHNVFLCFNCKGGFPSIQINYHLLYVHLLFHARSPWSKPLLKALNDSQRSVVVHVIHEVVNKSCFVCFSFGRDNYAFVTFFEHSSAAEAIESELKNAYCSLQIS